MTVLITLTDICFAILLSLVSLKEEKGVSLLWSRIVHLFPLRLDYLVELLVLRFAL